MAFHFWTFLVPDRYTLATLSQSNLRIREEDVVTCNRQSLETPDKGSALACLGLQAMSLRELPHIWARHKNEPLRNSWLASRYSTTALISVLHLAGAFLRQPPIERRRGQRESQGDKLKV